MNRKAWLRAAAFTFAAAIVAAFFSSLAAGRFDWGPPEIPKAQCEALAAPSVSPELKTALSLAYQERVAAAIIRERQNTWSNLAFVFVGALIWAHDSRTFARLFAAALIALGIASGLYHASLLPSWRTADVATMGWVSFALFCHGYVASHHLPVEGRPSTENRLWTELCIGVIGAGLAIIAAIFRNDVRIAGVKPFDTTYTTIAGIGAIFALAMIGIVRAARTHSGTRLPVARIGLLSLIVIAAVFCQLNDRPGRCFCAPDSLIQAHAIWHVLMAVAALLAYEVFEVIEGGPVRLL